jgi:peptidoglycan/LPS O-acetylase OafA/YrhL
MMIGGQATTDERILRTGNEAGTAPGDRRFRPDVQGLRAVAILLVVLFHAGIPGISGGYVGVDVFFVISGFVITGLLLREREVGGRTSFLNFYSRRARRIIPAASVVIIVTVIATYHYLGSLTGHDTAIDGQWAAVFLANFHFAASQTNYLASQRPPSALQNYWSLAVEEQFYIVYPTVFLVVASLVTRISLRIRLAILLVAVIVASYAFSIVFTSANPSSAFFSPLTRAWELALGGLIAVGSDRLRGLPRSLAAFLSWLGLAAIVTASVALTSASEYPGALVAIPVVGAALVIAAGTSQPAWGVEYLLRQKPFQLLGLISYSLYLWHWPILIIATQNRGATNLPVWDNVVLLLVATLVATLTYRVIENPVRHSGLLIRRRWASLTMGLCLIGATLVVTTHEEQRPAISLGGLASAASGTLCPLPPSSVISHLRSTYTSSHPQATGNIASQPQPVVVVGDSTSCTLLPGLQAVGPSYGMDFKNAAVVGCGVVSGETAPIALSNGAGLSEPTKLCQGKVNRDETEAIERYRPSLIVWGSTDERESIVNDTATGSTVVESGSSEWKSLMLQRMDDRVKKFLGTGARVILLSEPATVHGGSQTQPNAGDVAFERMNALLKRVAARHPKQVAVVDLEARVCPSGPPCPFVVDGFGSTGKTVIQAIGSAIRPDGIHYSRTSALWVARWLVPRIASAAAKLS